MPEYAAGAVALLFRGGNYSNLHTDLLKRNA